MFVNIKNRGAAFVMVVIFVSLITVAISAGFTMPVVREMHSASRDNLSNDAYVLAEGATEDLYYRMRNGMNVPASVTFTLGDVSATATITSIDANTSAVETEASNMSHVRRVRTEITNTATDLEFLYGAQIGNGGAILSNNASILGVGAANGDIYANSPIRGAAGAFISGDAYVSTGIFVDDYASSTICTQDRQVGKLNPTVDFAQSFLATSTQTLTKVELLIRKSGNPSSVPVVIVADNGGTPGTTTLSSGTLDRNKVTSTYAWVDITLAPSLQVTGGQTYWVILDATRSGSKYWEWCEDPTDSYTGGSAAYSNDWENSAFVNTGTDLAFKTNFGEGDSLMEDIVVNGDARAHSFDSVTIGGDGYYMEAVSTSIGGSPYPNTAPPPQVALPFTDPIVASWIADAEDGGTISGNCPGSAGCSDIMGPIKIDGDLSIPINDTLTLAGTVYVTGDFMPDNNTTLQCDTAFWKDSCILVVEGHIDISNNVIFQGSGQPESFILLISLIDSCDGGVQTAACAPGNSAIYIKNNATGAIFAATRSRVHIANGVTVSSVIGDSLMLENTATVLYDTELQDIRFSSGAGGGWRIDDWRETF